MPNYLANYSILTSEAIARVLPNKYGTLDRLFEYFGNDVFKDLQFVRE
jgi:hypothetical protein